MKKKKISYLPWLHLRNQKILKLFILLIFLSFVTYGLFYSITTLAQNTSPFYCQYTRQDRVYQIPCVWFRDLGLREIPSSNPNKYYPNQKLSEYIQFIPTLTAGAPNWRAVIRSQCLSSKRNNEYKTLIDSWKSGSCDNFATCLTDYYSGIFLHNLDLVKSRYSNVSEVYNLASQLEERIMKLDCSIAEEAIAAQLSDIHSLDISLSNLTEKTPGNITFTIPLLQKPTPPPITVNVNPLFCTYSQSSETFELPCTYFTSIGLSPAPSPTPSIYKGNFELQEFLDLTESSPYQIDKRLAGISLCQRLKTPISDFDSNVKKINSDFSDSTEKYKMIPEFFRRGIYLHVLQEIAQRPQSPQTNALLQEQATSISTFNCNQPETVILDKIKEWEIRDISISNSTSQGKPIFSGPITTTPYNPLFCSYKNPSDGVIYVILCDYVRRSGINLVPASSQIYQGNSALSRAYQETLNAGRGSFNEGLVRDVCRYVKVEPQDFDILFKQSADIMQIANQQNFIYTISLVSQNIENSKPLFGSKTNQLPNIEAPNIKPDTRVIDFREDTALLDTAVDIKKSKVKSNIDSMTREAIISELNTKFKLDPSQFSKSNLDQVRDFLKQKYKETTENYNLATNEVFERIPELNSQVVVNNIVFKTKNLNCNASRDELNKSIRELYELDQNLSDLSKKNSTDNFNKLKDLKQKFDIKF